MAEPEVHFEHSTTKPATIFELAAEFGLRTDEILQTVNATLDRLPEDTRARYIDELAGAFATRLVEKQRGYPQY